MSVLKPSFKLLTALPLVVIGFNVVQYVELK